jgi:hypothetical protein
MLKRIYSLQKSDNKWLRKIIIVAEKNLLVSVGNYMKTKYIVISTYEHRRNTGDLRIGNKAIEAVQGFQYLGNISLVTLTITINV